MKLSKLALVCLLILSGLAMPSHAQANGEGMRCLPAFHVVNVIAVISAGDINFCASSSTHTAQGTDQVYLTLSITGPVILAATTTTVMALPLLSGCSIVTSGTVVTMNTAVGYQATDYFLLQYSAGSRSCSGLAEAQITLVALRFYDDLIGFGFTTDDTFTSGALQIQQCGNTSTFSSTLPSTSISTCTTPTINSASTTINGTFVVAPCSTAALKADPNACRVDNNLLTTGASLSNPYAGYWFEMFFWIMVFWYIKRNRSLIMLPIAMGGILHLANPTWFFGLSTSIPWLAVGAFIDILMKTLRANKEEKKQRSMT